MDSDLLIRHTDQVPVEPSDEFLAAAAAKVRAEELLEKRRKELAPLIAAEVARGVKLAELGRKAGYTAEHVRRVARAHGVDATIDREPPHKRAERLLHGEDPTPPSGSSANSTPVKPAADSDVSH